MKKTLNMIQLYTTSIDKLCGLIQNKNTKLSEKYAYTAIIFKFFIECENMLKSVNIEKK